MSSEKRRQRKKQPQTTYSQVFSNFAGDQLAFLMKGVKGRSGGQVLNLTLEGYLLDEDVDFFYIGVTPEEITGVIRKSEVVTMFKGTYDLNTEEFNIPEGSGLQ